MRSARNGCRVLGGSPWHGGWRRIEPNPSLLGSYSSLIAPAIFTGPEWLPEFQVRSNKAGSTRMPDIATQIAGIDASKNHLDMAIHGHAKVTRVPNTVAGWKTLATGLVAAGVARAGIEATGGYERGVMGYLRDQGVVVTLLQPVQVKAFGMLHLKRAKTDRIDAVLIAACTQVLGDRNRMTPDARFEALGDHLTFIEQIEEDIARFKTRLEHISDKRLRRSVEASIKREQMRRLLEIKRLIDVVRAHDDLSKRFLLVSERALGRRAHGPCPTDPHARARPGDPRTGGVVGRAGAVRSSERQMAGSDTDRRRAQPVAALAVRGRVPRGASLEQAADEHAQSPARAWSVTHQRNRRLRAKAVDPGQRRGGPWHTVARPGE